MSPSKIDSHEFELLKLCEEHGVEYSNGYGLATCTCNQDNERLAWVDTHYYDPTCGVVRPNFSYQGVEIVIENIEWVLAQEDPDSYRLSWNE